ARLVSEQGLLIRERQYLAHLDLRFVPLEYQDAFRLQDSEALRESLPQVFAPVLAKDSVLQAQPASEACFAQVRRIKHHQAEAAIGEGHLPEVHLQVWRDVQGPPIT